MLQASPQNSCSPFYLKSSPRPGAMAFRSRFSHDTSIPSSSNSGSAGLVGKSTWAPSEIAFVGRPPSVSMFRQSSKAPSPAGFVLAPTFTTSTRVAGSASSSTTFAFGKTSSLFGAAPSSPSVAFRFGAAQDQSVATLGAHSAASPASTKKQVLFGSKPVATTYYGPTAAATTTTSNSSSSDNNESDTDSDKEVMEEGELSESSNEAPRRPRATRGYSVKEKQQQVDNAPSGGRFHNTRAEALGIAPTPQFKTLGILDVHKKPDRRHYQAPPRQLGEMQAQMRIVLETLAVQGEKIAHLEEENQNLQDRLYKVEKQKKHGMMLRSRKSKHKKTTTTATTTTSLDPKKKSSGIHGMMLRRNKK